MSMNTMGCTTSPETSEPCCYSMTITTDWMKKTYDRCGASVQKRRVEGARMASSYRQRSTSLINQECKELTVFHNGSIYVFNALPHEAEYIMSLLREAALQTVSQSSHSSHNSERISAAAAVCSDSSRLRGTQRNVWRKSSSLHRFLEQRKERFRQKGQSGLPRVTAVEHTFCDTNLHLFPS